MKNLKYLGYLFAVVAVLMIGFKVGDWWRMRKTANQISELATTLQKTTETLEITTGLYSKQSFAYQDLAKYLEAKTSEMVALKKQLDDSKASLLTANQLTLKWKRAYEAVLAANQTDAPPVDGGSSRKRVDFEGKLGPIHATGHTLTDPPEAFLKLEQTDPLKLTVAVAQNKDKTWSTFVTSSDPNVNVTVDLAGVNPLVISPKWYQRIWLDVGAAAIGDPAGYLGASWRGDRYSAGALCYASGGSMNGCGATLGVRLFK